MEKQKFILLDIDLGLFDGEGGAPAGAGGAEAGVASPTGKDQPKTPTKVIYGKVDGEAEGTGDAQKAPDEADAKPDPNAAFESMIKGEYKEQFDKRVQDIINKRFKDVKAIETKLGEVDPVIKLLQRKYGTDKAQEIYSRMEAEYIEEMAYSEGMTPEKYRTVYQAEETIRQQQEAQRQQDEQDRINQTVERWTREGEALKAEYPDFDLSEAVKNDSFLDMLKSGVPVKAAYEILNIDNIKAQIHASAQTQVAQSIQAKQSRPKEAAAANSHQGVVIKSDVKNLTKEDRAEAARRAQRGERIVF